MRGATSPLLLGVAVMGRAWAALIGQQGPPDPGGRRGGGRGQRGVPTVAPGTHPPGVTGVRPGRCQPSEFPPPSILNAPRVTPGLPQNGWPR